MKIFRLFSMVFEQRSTHQNRSSTIPRFLHHLLQYEIVTPDNENLLLEHLGIPFERSSPMKLSINILIILLKIVLQRKNTKLICSLWEKFLQGISQTTEELTREHLQIFLIFFHQLSIAQRKTILLQLVQTIQSTKENLYLLILFKYLIYNFYEIPSELIEQIQQLITKNDLTLTTNFHQLISKNNSSYLDSLALKSLYQSSIYHSFYEYLIDLTRLDEI